MGVRLRQSALRDDMLEFGIIPFGAIYALFRDGYLLRAL